MYRSSLRRYLTCITTLSAVGVLLAADAPVAPPTVQDIRREVEATFDPNGAMDNAGLVKWPEGPPSGEDDLPFDESSLQGSLPNDACSGGTVIPGNVTTYNPAPYSTTTADVETCDNLESCEVSGVGVSNSVWYSYTPDANGQVEINTQGSSYNTVLSVWTGCRTQIGALCIGAPTQLACNDNAPEFGNPTWSRIFLDVTAGQNYRIKVADYNTTSGGGTLDFNLLYRPPNDLCANATRITTVAYNPPLLRTGNAVSDLCDNEESCELNAVGTSNSVWYVYTPPCDGSVSVNTNGSNYDTVLSIWTGGCEYFVDPDVGCSHVSTQIACDDDSGVGTQSQLVNVPVLGGVEYLIKASDYNLSNGGGNLDFNFVFHGAGNPNADIVSPSGFGCVCGTVSVTGTASTGSDPYSEWVLDYRPQTGGAWTQIATSTNPVNNGTLSSWNTSALNGYYFLRLTVRNSCGEENTDVEIVYVDGQIPSLEVREPDGGEVLGGIVCLDGTAWDQCFDSYTVRYRALPGGVFAPIEPGVLEYTTAVTNDGLGGGWNTQAPAVADGQYELQVAVFDTCGHSTSALRTVTIDNTAPTAIITSPQACSVVSGVVQIMGTADDANLAGWALQRSDPNNPGWITISSGNTPVINGLLGTLDTNGLEPCCYAIRLLVSDQSLLNCANNSHLSEYLITVDFAGQGLVGDMNCDGAVTVSDIAGFVIALTNPTLYAQTYPMCNINNADANGDHAVTVSDIGPFVTLLTSMAQMLAGMPMHV